jgi:hypothetical protein
VATATLILAFRPSPTSASGLILPSDIHCETRPGETFRSEGGERLETLQHRRNVARARARRLADH